MADPIEEEIQQEIKANKILIYGKGTKAMPMCGFTRETMHFFEKYGYPYELIDVLSQPAKREALTKLTNWPTLPKVFIDGQFYGYSGPHGSQGRSGAVAEEGVRS